MPPKRSLSDLRAAAVRAKAAAAAALGLGTKALPATASKKSPRKRRQKPDDEDEWVPQRRSARVAALEADESSSSDDDSYMALERDAKVARRERRRAPKTKNAAPASAPSEDPSQAEPAPAPSRKEARFIIHQHSFRDRKQADKRSCKVLSVDLGVVSARWLGRSVPIELGGSAGRQAKRAAMNAAAGHTMDDTAAVPSYAERIMFNKMSGIQEWKNAVTLFVNVDDNSYDNLFSEGGKKMLWYAQRRHDERNPVFLRILSLSGADLDAVASADKARSGWHSKQPQPIGARADDAKPSSVCVFFRFGSGPYIFGGRVSYVRHWPGSRPIQVEFELTDLEALKQAGFVDRLNGAGGGASEAAAAAAAGGAGVRHGGAAAAAGESALNGAEQVQVQQQEQVEEEEEEEEEEAASAAGRSRPSQRASRAKRRRR